MLVKLSISVVLSLVAWCVAYAAYVFIGMIFSGSDLRNQLERVVYYGGVTTIGILLIVALYYIWRPLFR